MLPSPEADFSTLRWRKSSRSTAGNDCVEVAAARGICAVRDSKNPTAGHLAFRSGMWRQFLAALKNRTDAQGMPRRT
jgi:hypothetical protein